MTNSSPPQRVVDSLELIYIDKQHRELFALAFRQ